MADEEQSSSTSPSTVAKARLMINKFIRNFENSPSNSAFSTTYLAKQCRTLQSSFATVEASMSFREKELKANERELCGIVRRVEQLQQTVAAKQKEVELREEEVVERLKEVEKREVDLKVREEGMNSRESRIQERFEEKEKEMKLCEEDVKSKEEVILVRFKEVEFKEKEVNERYLSCMKELELKKQGLIESHRDLKLQHKNLDVQRAALKLNEERLMEEYKALELKEKEADECFELVKSKDKELSQDIQALKLKEKEINESYNELDLMKKKLDQRCLEVDRKEKEMNEWLELQQKLMNDSGIGLELKEKEVDERFRALVLKEKEMNKGKKFKEKELTEGFQALELSKRQLDECRAVLELKEKEIDKYFKVVKLEEKQMNCSVEALELKVVEIEDCCKGIELKHRQAVEWRGEQLNGGLEALEKKAKEIEEKDKEMKEYSKVLDLKDEDMNKRMRALDLREQQIDERCRIQESKEKRLNEDLQALELEKKRIDRNYREVELRKKEINDRYEALDLREHPKNEFCRRCESEVKQITETFKSAKSKTKNMDRSREGAECRENQSRGTSKENGSSTLDQVETKEPLPLVTTAAASSSRLSDKSDNIQILCKNMDMKGVRSYLIHHVKEYDVVEDYILNPLWLAPDPAKLVLDVIQSFHELELEAVKAFTVGCIYFLIQLMKLRSDVPSHVKDEAGKFANIWKSMLKQDNTPLENLGFLQFLASFKLAESYRADELFSCFITFFDQEEVYRPERNPTLCYALGLTGKIPDLVRSLISRDKQLQAIRYICALKMEDAFPLIPLLRTHLVKIQQRVEEMLKEDSITAQDDAANMESFALKEVVKLISDFKLESRGPCYSPVSLELRIKQLEEGRTEKKTTTDSFTTTKFSDLENTGVKEMAETSNTPVLPSDKKRSSNSIGSSKQEKCRRVTAHNPISAPITPRVWPNGYTGWQHQFSPPMSWFGYPYGSSGIMYNIPYNSSAGDFGVAGIFPNVTPTSTYNARSRAQEAARGSDSITIETGNMLT